MSKESTAVAIVPSESREFALSAYLDNIAKPAALKQQQALAAAYDAACTALIGPNDVQQEGSRSFKKKSAWRKLARHFNISVAASLDSVRVDLSPDGFTAYAVATASAPWGQSWTDVGACGSDEATGRRQITTADAIATAMTRASNRAVSNLIAMGEVSAEEIGQRKSYDSGGNDAPRRQNTAPKSDADKTMPFGRNKGVRLGDIDSANLESTLKWCREKGKSDLGDAIHNVLTERALSGGVEPFEDEEKFEAERGGLRDDDLPF